MFSHKGCAVCVCSASLNRWLHINVQPLFRGNAPTTPRLPLGFSDFYLYTFICPFVRLVLSHPQILHFKAPFPNYNFPFAPLGCLAWLLAQINTRCGPQPSKPFGRTTLPFPKHVECFTLHSSLTPCLLCTSPWPEMSQKKKIPHGKLFLFPSITYLTEMSQGL